MDRDILHIQKMLEAIADIDVYVKGKNENDFLDDNLLKDACLMKLIVIGENGGKVSDILKSRFGEIEWQQMKAARNFFAHTYEYVDWVMVWNTITDVLPALKTKLEHVLESLNN